jgi:hypothetical protein
MTLLKILAFKAAFALWIFTDINLLENARWHLTRAQRHEVINWAFRVLATVHHLPREKR